MPAEEQKNRVLSEKELRELMRDTVRETLLTLGCDISDPTEVQRDFIFIRSWRKNTESVKGKTLVAAAGVVVAGALGLLWLGIRALLPK